MVVVDKLDELGKPAWIALMILGFIAWWPLGLVTLAFILGSGRMGCWSHHGRWQENMGRWQSKMDRMQEKMERLRGRMDRARSSGGGFWGGPPSSGNRAFDDYRADTLRRLEEEQREFKEFLERLRFAKDRAEFDQFMAERRKGSPDQGPQPQAS
jgi:erythromycin esterase-like protein